MRLWRADHLMIIDGESDDIVATCEVPAEGAEDQAEANAKRIAVACRHFQRMRGALADLVEWQARMGGWESEEWRRAEKVLDDLRKEGY